MKAKLFFIVPVILFMFMACDKEEMDNVQEADISDIAFLSTSSLEQPQEISVTIVKPTPCHTISEVEKTAEGFVYTYNFILSEPGADTACVQMIANETVVVVFDPAETGEHTLNFLINGKLFETRQIMVAE